MSSTISSVRSSPIPDLAYDSYRSMSMRDQNLVKRHLTTNNSSTLPGSSAYYQQQYQHPPPPPGQDYNYNHGVEDYHPHSHHYPQSATLGHYPYFQQDQNYGGVLNGGGGHTNNGFGSVNLNGHHHQSQPHQLQPQHQSQSQSQSRVEEENMMQSQDPRTGKVTVTLAQARRSSNLVVTNGMAYSIEKYWGESLAFWILLGVLALLIIANSILTFLIYGVLRLGKGMESIEYLPKHLKFSGNADLDEIYKRDGLIQGFYRNPVEIIGEKGGEVHLWVREGSQPSLSVERNLINITKVTGVRVVDRKGRAMFSTNTPTLGLPRGVQKLDVKVAKTNRITSALNASLQMESTSFTYLRGSEGTHMEGKQFTLKADQDISLKSVNGSITLLGKEGIYLNVHDLPLVRDGGVTRQSYTYTTHGKKESQFQLCVCMPEGKLFRIEIPVNNNSRPPHQRVGCHHAMNPC